MNWPTDFVDKIICGDCLEVMKDIPDDSVDLVFTSPPYFNQRTYSEEDFKDKKSGCSSVRSDINRSEYQQFIQSVMKECFRVIKDGGIIAWNIGEDRGFDLKSYSSIWLDEVGFKYQDTIEWHKRGGSGIRCKNIKSIGKYYPSFIHEPIFVYKKGDQMKNTMDENHSKSMRGWEITNCWFIQSVQSIDTEGHPAPFPLKLAEQVLKCYTKKGDLVLEPFSGSGTTPLAALKMSRRYIGIELSRDYCDIAEKRLLKIPTGTRQMNLMEI